MPNGLANLNLLNSTFHRLTNILVKMSIFNRDDYLYTHFGYINSHIDYKDINANV